MISYRRSNQQKKESPRVRRITVYRGLLKSPDTGAGLAPAT